jgi:mono/diheme cytochrome c family protein
MNGKSFFVVPLLALAGFVAVIQPVPAQAPQFTPREESPEEFPPAPGREEAFYSCTACHNFKLVAAQGQTRRQWEDTINLMVERHGMPALEGNDRKLVLDYLETAFPPRARAPGGWQNPFLNR